MEISGKKIGAVLAVLVAVGVGVWYAVPTSVVETDVPAQDERGVQIETYRQHGKSGRRRPAKGGSAERVKLPRRVVNGRPVVVADHDDEVRLSDEMKKVLADLQSALDQENKREVIKIAMDIQKRFYQRGEAAKVPSTVKRDIIAALRWFSPDTLPELLGFLGDPDPEVNADAISAFEDELTDADIGDKAISEILKKVVKVVNDADALDNFFMEMNNMRNSVKVDTALAIFDSGNPDAIRVLQENLDFYFTDADYEMKTRQDVEKYGKDPEHADDPDDDEIFGPTKNSD
ncbi:MAG: hypothetical protein MJ249_00820 [Kiritimatiellae bacterium]|nr:hypothetical protein [Kiritimatiellia bacterium]